jgi:ketopantoate hydroxymethyltransferase
VVVVESPGMVVVGEDPTLVVVEDGIVVVDDSATVVVVVDDSGMVVAGASVVVVVSSAAFARPGATITRAAKPATSRKRRRPHRVPGRFATGGDTNPENGGLNREMFKSRLGPRG